MFFLHYFLTLALKKGIIIVYVNKNVKIVFPVGLEIKHFEGLTLGVVI